MTCTNAIALFNNKDVKGYVSFHQCHNKQSTHVTINLSHLKPNKTRAIHIHEYGDESNGCISLGSHWNPNKNTHGTIYKKNMPSHAGDMINNIYPDPNGKFFHEYEDKRIKLRGNVNKSIIGRSIVIHENKDDLGLGNNKESKKTGNAGKRIACAIIGQAQPGKEISF